nr:uncharacterized protein LOC122273281 [Parasteatoda tepidariorum]
MIKSSLKEETSPVRILLDNGSMRTFLLEEVSKRLKLPIVRSETLSVYTFGADGAQEKIYDVVKIRLANRDQLSLNIELEALVTIKNFDQEHSNNTIATEVLNRKKNNNVKLPKLSIEKYYGDPSVRIEFWNQFQSTIDKNETLSVIDKFSYLKSLLGGAAANVVNGFSLSEENYVKAVKLLKERFGRDELVINAHMNKLLNLYPVKDANNVLGLRKLYDTCEVQIRSLDSLKVTSGMYGHLLYPILIKLIPEELALSFNRRKLDKANLSDFDVMELINFLKIEIECRETVSFQNSRVDRKRNFINHNTVAKQQFGN